MLENHQKLLGKWSVCPKTEGGPGVLDLRKQNEALMMKNLHKFFNDFDIPCSLIWEKLYPKGKLSNFQKKGGFWWRANLKLFKKIKSLAVIQINGQSCLLWEDTWLDMSVKEKFPELFSFAKDRQLTISMAKISREIDSILPFASVSPGLFPISGTTA